MLIQNIKNIYHGIKAYKAANKYGFPGKKIKVIGITGTDGKTTTTHLVHHILKAAGKKTSMVSSVYAEIAGAYYDTGFHVTTPDSYMLQKFLKQAYEAGDEYMVLEVTSHGLDQNRVLGIDFYIGVLTNITHEHLDYHKTYENYIRSKETLLKKAKLSVINKDDESFAQLHTNDYHLVKTYAIKDITADVTLEKFPFSSPLPGEYNIYNCLAAIAVAKEIGISNDNIKKALKNFPGVKGRFESISTSYGFNVIVDFAHTPNAIDKVLQTVKPMVKGKLIHIFGSAAKRDVAKRPIMGKNSAQFADIIILTEEDYRSESVEKINEEIAKGARELGVQELLPNEYDQKKSYTTPILFKIPNRADAINFAIAIAKKGDAVIATGKAHEKSLCRGSIEYPWSEHDAIAQALKKRGAS